MRKPFLILILATFLTGCVLPAEDRSELIQQPPSETFTVNRSYDEVLYLWKTQLGSLCMLDSRPTTQVVELKRGSVSEIHIRYALSGPFYGIIRISRADRSSTLVEVFDIGSYPCISRNYLPFLKNI